MCSGVTPIRAVDGEGAGGVRGSYDDMTVEVVVAQKNAIPGGRKNRE